MGNIIFTHGNTFIIGKQRYSDIFYWVIHILFRYSTDTSSAGSESTLSVAAYGNQLFDHILATWKDVAGVYLVNKIAKKK